MLSSARIALGQIPPKSDEGWPSARQGHSAVMRHTGDGDEVWIFGGCVAQSHNSPHPSPYCHDLGRCICSSHSARRNRIIDVESRSDNALWQLSSRGVWTQITDAVG